MFASRTAFVSAANSRKCTKIADISVKTEQRPNEMSTAIPPEQFKIITQLTYTADDVKEKFAIYFQQVATYYTSPPLLLAICEQKQVLNDNLRKIVNFIRPRPVLTVCGDQKCVDV